VYQVGNNKEVKTRSVRYSTEHSALFWK